MNNLIQLDEYRKAHHAEVIGQAAAVPIMMFWVPVLVFSAIAILWLTRS